MKWEPFQPAMKPIPSIKYFKKTFGIKKDEAIRMQNQMKDCKIFLNNLYEVEVRIHRPSVDWPDMLWLSIKRIDKQPIHDWRHLQRIKNELVGKENEAVELYPAESRLVDAANQFHLWVLADSNVRFPFGFRTKKAVATPEQAAKVGAVQRPFED